MRYASFERPGKAWLGVREGDAVGVIGEQTLEALLVRGEDLSTYDKTHAGDDRVDPASLKWSPPLRRPPNIIASD
jgi:acylpyruvate hydrolase